LRTPERPLVSESPLSPFHQPTPRLSYRMVLVLAGAALGFGGLLAVTHGHDSDGFVSSLPWLLAAITLIFSLSMAVLITLSFARRLDALARAARRVAFGRGQADPDPTEGDAIASLARSLTRLTERITELQAERERSSEQEQGRLDAQVRERTREVGAENEDLRRVVGDSKGVLSVDAQGKVIGQFSSHLIPKWLGAAPHDVLFWDYFEQATPGAGARFHAAWIQLCKSPGELDVRRMPRTLAVADRYLSVEYHAVRDGNGQLRRMLVVLTDITIPEPDPATPL
jgi:HAMP domain-containing protein